MIKKTFLILTSAIALLTNANAYTIVTLTGGNFTAGPFLGQSVATFKVGDAETTLTDWNAGIANEASLGFDIGTPTSGGASFPVENVSWYDAVKWCNLESINDAKTPVYQIASLPVTSVTRNSTTATVTTTNEHGLSTGNHVTVAGATPAGYNLTAAVTVVTPTTFTYTVNGSLTTPANGTITAGVIYKTGEIIPTVNASANGYRLPTEKEWQWAAIGGVNQNTFVFSGNNTASVVAWSSTNSPTGAKAVKTKAANTQNIYDMSGNVFEWCFDEVSGVVGRRVRGGGWVVDADSCQISIRGYSQPARQEAGFGFRVYSNN
jgi:formylglycine-generating enzyme required for sulfatase activity